MKFTQTGRTNTPKKELGEKIGPGKSYLNDLEAFKGLVKEYYGTQEADRCQKIAMASDKERMCELPYQFKHSLYEHIKRLNTLFGPVKLSDIALTLSEKDREYGVLKPRLEKLQSEGYIDTIKIDGITHYINEG